jgi:hypothetical protein
MLEYEIAIETAITGLSETAPKHDPLFEQRHMVDASYIDSARKRHGLIIEAAFRDAFTEAGLDCRKYMASSYGIEIDAVVYAPQNGVLLGVDVKRGTSFHDSGKKRSMIKDVPRALSALSDIGEARGFNADLHFGYYHHYSQTNKSHVSPITAVEIEYLTGVNVRRMIEKATEDFKRRLRI